nr:venom protein U-MPTX.14-Mc31 [Megalopyge crispata]
MSKILLFIVASICSTNGQLVFKDETRTPFGDSIDKVATNLLREKYQSSQDKNIITSPLGVFTLLALYSPGTTGRAREEIIQAVGASTYNDLVTSYGSLSESLSRLDADNFVLKNKIYVSKQYSILSNFSSFAIRQFQSEVEKINFGNPQHAADVINDWAERETRHHIKNAVSGDTLDPSTAVALFNVMFFQGSWHLPFKRDETRDRKFYIDKKRTVQKSTMHLSEALFYKESKELEAEIIELPYKNKGGFRMLVVLPKQIDGLPRVLENVRKHGLLKDAYSLEATYIDFSMPKFTIESTLDLNELLPKIGVRSIFTEPAPNIVKKSKVVVSKAFQKALIIVDEEGPTAGASTGSVDISLCSHCRGRVALQVRVDHPFLFAVLQQDKIAFVGTYTH